MAETRTAQTGAHELKLARQMVVFADTHDAQIIKY